MSRSWKPLAHSKQNNQDTTHDQPACPFPSRSPNLLFLRLRLLPPLPLIPLPQSLHSPLTHLRIPRIERLQFRRFHYSRDLDFRPRLMFLRLREGETRFRLRGGRTVCRAEEERGRAGRERFLREEDGAVVGAGGGLKERGKGGEEVVVG